MASPDMTTTRGLVRRSTSPRRLQLVTLVAVLAIWELVSVSGLLYHGVVPSLLEIAAAFVRLISSPLFWSNFSVTMFEIVCAVLIGSMIGIVSGLLIGSSRLVAASVEPLINGIASTPKVIFLPLLYLAFGIGVGSKIAAGSIGCFFPLVIGVTAAMLHINPVLIRVGRSFDLSWWQMIEKIYLPSMIEPIGNGLRISVGVAFGVVLIGETRFSYAGLGYMVIDSFNRSRFPQVYAVLIIIIALAMAATAVVNRLTSGPRFAHAVR